ncbi:hypothetical protein [Halorarius litoreus]|uniref:hypothetical protein n=1 Tax=Halorarius litoreus TaxID=2962676 RepID=UPI0020CDD6D6|nr:hypothetical protein [Halorarius litoreus]
MNLVARLRQPEYTGENRCIPCTATNVAIAAVLSVGVGVVYPPAGAALFVGSLLAIWLRGYLVPGTPELTKRYFPDWLLAYFDKGPQVSGATDAAADADLRHDVDPETLLLEAGVVEPCAEEDDLCLADDFRDGWTDRMDALREAGADREALADRLDVDSATLRFEEHDDGFEAFDGDRRLGQWESRAALLADLAAAAELPEYVDDWDRLAVGAKAQVLGGLRVFVETCPECDGAVTAGTETVTSCCRSHEVVAVGCADCGARLLEVPYQGEPA